MTLTYSVKNQYFAGIGVSPAVAYRYTQAQPQHMLVILLHVRLNKENKHRLKFKQLLENINNRVKLILFL